MSPATANHRSFTAVVILLVWVVLLGACAGAGEDVETVDFDFQASEATKPEPTPTQQPLSTDAAEPDADEPEADDCVVELVRDEYGFEVEVASCEDPKPRPEPASFSTLDAFVGSDKARTLLAGIRDRIVFQSGCVDGQISGFEVTTGEAVRDAVLAIPDPDVVVAVTELFNAVSAADDGCGQVASWIPETRNSLVAMHTLESLFVETPEPALGSRVGEAKDLTLVTADIMTAYDRLYFALAGKDALEGSDFWFSSSHLAHVRGLRMLKATGQLPSVVIVGSSIIGRSVDPNVMTSQLGVEVMSAALIGAQLPAQIFTLDQLMDIIDEPITIVWGESSDRYFRGFVDCGLPELVQITDILKLQEIAFIGIAALTDASPLDLMLGSDLASPTYGPTPILADGVQLHGGWERGALPQLTTVPQPEVWNNQIERLEERNSAPDPCESLIELAADAIERWTNEGNRVMVYAAPVADELAAIHPQDRAGHDAVNDRLREDYGRVGATFLDLSTLLTRSEFMDVTHPNGRGRELVTATLIAALAEENLGS